MTNRFILSSKINSGVGLMQGDVILINQNFNSGGVHGQGLAKRAGFSDQHPAALAQGAVDGLHNAGTSTAFGTAPVLPAGQHPHVGVPQAREVPAAGPPVGRRQGLPQAPGRRGAPVAQHLGHNAPTFPLNRQPQPNLALFTPHERPQLIEFERCPAPLFPFLGRSCGSGGEADAAFFTNLAIVIRATPVAQMMLRWELRSTNNCFT